MILALALALASSLATSVAFLLKQRGAVLAPSVRVRHPLRSAVALFRSRWFALGWVVAVGAWGLHVGALALAPLSVVQAVLAAGLVFLAVLAERFFGFALGPRQWIGVIITAIGLAIIALTVGPRGDDAPGYALTALIVVECTVFVLATGLAVRGPIVFLFGLAGLGKHALAAALQRRFPAVFFVPPRLTTGEVR